MSFLDMDEALIDLAEKVELVYSPLVDVKEFPDEVDMTLVEGAVSSEEDCTRSISSASVPGRWFRLATAPSPPMCHPCAIHLAWKAMLRSRLRENATLDAGIPESGRAQLCRSAIPVHEVVAVDVFVPGCPPPADVIFYLLTELLEGRKPELSAKTKFGA